MTPLEMIAEWSKGCSCATAGNPEECQECTRALIDAIERSVGPIESLKSVRIDGNDVPLVDCPLLGCNGDESGRTYSISVQHNPLDDRNRPSVWDEARRVWLGGKLIIDRTKG